MAILDAIPGLEVSVVVNGQALPEYDSDDMNDALLEVNPNHQGRLSSKFIECASGQDFVLKFVANADYERTSPSLLFKLYVAGVRVGSKSLHLRERHHGRRVLGLLEFTKSTDRETMITTKRSLRFAEIQTTEDDDDLPNVRADAATLTNTGYIQVRVFRIVERDARVPNFHGPPKLLSKPLKVHEKAMKGQAKSHNIIPGQTFHEPANPSLKAVTFLDGPLHPIGVFLFHYRSREALKQLLIIERTPSPEPEPASAASRMVLRSHSRRAIKRERDDDDDEEEEIASPARRKLARVARGTVAVDLTMVVGDEEDAVGPSQAAGDREEEHGPRRQALANQAVEGKQTRSDSFFGFPWLPSLFS